MRSEYYRTMEATRLITEVKWKVLTPNTMEQYLADLEAGEALVSAYYGLTTQGYENLSNIWFSSKMKTVKQITVINYSATVE